ncbi:PA2169 family four-helix-bundle protein [Christiangramia sp. SM2212]|uniref:PA2169 family four-helix-bundle protein n=1 Tax=Christiangramia sediminicola TaxID=3073267 RepID=A0ABU1EPA7_9FLAO|nr:PA2169 family four-helix-bundle protein [Christiangramia sp. SM2212]MDR5590230.1 PA2169 family four-helix-bundle protein [Christiangramia sp. SM2212]
MKTTREIAREASHKSLVHVLTNLLEKNYDAEKGYKKAMEHTSNLDLRQFLKNQAVQRNHFATEIDKQIHLLNEHPKEKSNGSTLGSIHRFWMEIKGSWAKKDDESILEECLRGEKASLKEYEEQLKNHMFTLEIKELLESHRDAIQKTLRQIKILEDLED